MLFIFLLLILNILVFHSAFLGIIFSAVYFFIYGKKLGRWIFNNSSASAEQCPVPTATNNIFEKPDPTVLLYPTLFGVFFLLSFFSIAGAIIYYIYKLNNLIIIFLILITPYIINKLYKKWPIPQDATARAVAYNYLKWVRRIFFIIFNLGNLRNLFKNKLRNFFGKGCVILKTAYILSYLTLLIILFTSATTDAIRSPWLVISKYFFPIYIIATILLIVIILKNKKSSIIFIILHFLLSSSIALIVYKLGYGFDPFIHQATEKVIFNKGFITPKPLYYLGQYSIVVIMAKITQISVSAIDKLLVPLLFSIFVPIFAFYGIISLVSNHKRHNLLTQTGDISATIKYTELAILAILILPFTSFISTTPQGLANVYAIIIIFFSLKATFRNVAFVEKNKRQYILIFLAMATLAIHPLTGIPVAIFVLIFIFLQSFLARHSFSDGRESGWGSLVPRKKILKSILLVFIIATSSIILPLTFYINSKISNASQISVGAQNFEPLQNFIPLQTSRQYHFIRDFIYLYGFNIVLIFLIISIIGIVLIYRAKGDNSSYRLETLVFPYLLTFLILLINYLILKNFIKFNSLIYYEQGDYAERLFGLSLYFLLPFFITAFYYFFRKLCSLLCSSSLETSNISQKEISLPAQAGHNPPLKSGELSAKYTKNFFLTLFVLWITASLYLTYPRYDNYVSSHGFNVSEADFKAVEYINKNAKSESYIVLANQNTSAAALAEYGFLKYFDNCRGTKSCAPTAGNQIFYYPIPTSSPLYEYYLSMVNTKPSRKTMRNAMDLVGVKEGYFVVSAYWWKADQIIENAKLEADGWEEIDRGKIWVFKYLR